MLLGQLLVPRGQRLEACGVQLQARSLAFGPGAVAVAQRPQRVSALAPLARRDDAQSAAQFDQYLRQLVAAAAQTIAERVVLLECGAHRRRQRLRVLAQPRLKLGALRLVQRCQLRAGHKP